MCSELWRPPMWMARCLQAFCMASLRLWSQTGCLAHSVSRSAQPTQPYPRTCWGHSQRALLVHEHFDGQDVVRQLLQLSAGFSQLRVRLSTMGREGREGWLRGMPTCSSAQLPITNQRTSRCYLQRNTGSRVLPTCASCVRIADRSRMASLSCTYAACTAVEEARSL